MKKWIFILTVSSLVLSKAFCGEAKYYLTPFIYDGKRQMWTPMLFQRHKQINGAMVLQAIPNCVVKVIGDHFTIEQDTVSVVLSNNDLKSYNYKKDSKVFDPDTGTSK